MPPSPTRERPSWQGIAGLVLTAACARFLPHMPDNFSPVGAMGMYAGAMLPWPWALGVALSGLFLSDLVLGLYHPVAMLFVYAGVGSNVVLGHILGRKRLGFLPALIMAPLGAVLFFLLSNFGVWLAGTIYPLTETGLADCYLAAIPFFGNTLMSQLLFSVLLFGAHRALGFSVPHPQGREHA